MSKIYLINGGERHALEAIGEGAVLSEALSGEQTLRFTVIPDDLSHLATGTPITDSDTDPIQTDEDLDIHAGSLFNLSNTALVEFEGQYYDIATVRLTGNALAAFAEVSAEHVTYRLNRPEYNIESLNVGGSYGDVLTRVLAGTDFTAGTTPEGTIETTVIEGVSRREALNSVAELMSGELEFDGWTVNVVTHRGSSTRIDLMATGNVSAIEVDKNLITGENTYRIGLIRRGELEVGDEVQIDYRPFGMHAETRIIAMTRNPYKETDCTITVGVKIPEITDTFVDVTRKVLYKSEADITIRKYINSAEGTAELETVLSGTFVSQSQLDDYPTFSELDASFGQYIDGQTGQAKIISAVSGTYQTIDSMSDYATTQSVSTSITQAVSQLEGEIDLTAEYGRGTIGSEVRALLQLVANPDSSQIMLKASKIIIDGDLYVQKIFNGNITVFESDITEISSNYTRLDIHIGDRNANAADNSIVHIIGDIIEFETPASSQRYLTVDAYNAEILPVSPNNNYWTFGNDYNWLSKLHLSRLYFENWGYYLYLDTSGHLVYHGPGGDTTLA